MGDREKGRQRESERDRQRDILQITGQMNRESEPNSRQRCIVYILYMYRERSLKKKRVKYREKES